MKLYILLIFISIVTASTLRAQFRTDTSLTLLYGTNEYELTATQKQEIVDFLRVISKITEIHGYTDTLGTMQSNRKLGKQRAQHVLNFIAGSLETNIIPLSSGEEFEQHAELSENRKVVISGEQKSNASFDTAASETLALDSFEVENINFLPDQATLTPASLRAIPALISKVKLYNNVYFEIVGHVNYQSNRDPQFLKALYTLSAERAKLICQVLSDSGIPKNRLRYVGVGNSQPLIRNPENDDEKKKNMRVQIIVSTLYRNPGYMKLEDFK